MHILDFILDQVNTNPLDDSYGDHMLTLVKMKKREEELESKLESKKQEFAERMEMCALMKAQLKRRRDEVWIVYQHA